jgi:hypothetical protein
MHGCWWEFRRLEQPRAWRWGSGRSW